MGTGIGWVRCQAHTARGYTLARVDVMIRWHLAAAGPPCCAARELDAVSRHFSLRSGAYYEKLQKEFSRSHNSEEKEAGRRIPSNTISAECCHVIADGNLYYCEHLDGKNGREWDDDSCEKGCIVAGYETDCNECAAVWARTRGCACAPRAPPASNAHTYPPTHAMLVVHGMCMCRAGACVHVHLSVHLLL